MSGKVARLFVISGPSGAGKGTLIARVRERVPNLALTVSATTREPREDEVDGVHYHFLTDADFDRRVDAGDFLEWAEVHGHRYGTLRSEVDGYLLSATSVVLEIDVQGALNVRRACPDAVLIFVEPPSMEELERRLRGRGTESDASLALRLDHAVDELGLASRYDERIVNDDLERATVRLENLIGRYERDGGQGNVCDQAGD